MPRLESPRYPGRPATSDDLFVLMGLPGQHKWPAAGLPPRLVQGILVWVNPAVPKFSKVWNGYEHAEKRVKSSTHRVMCKCPTCKTVVSAGRLFQHKCPSNDVGDDQPLSQLGDQE